MPNKSDAMQKIGWKQLSDARRLLGTWEYIKLNVQKVFLRENWVFAENKRMQDGRYIHEKKFCMFFILGKHNAFFYIERLLNFLLDVPTLLLFWFLIRPREAAVSRIFWPKFKKKMDRTKIILPQNFWFYPAHITT